MAAAPVAAQDEIIVTAPRLQDAVGDAVFAQDRLSADDLALSPSSRLDATLSTNAGFSLFRRADSRSANPTTQGATLRGLGPNGAGRALVLLDGVPQNDPFGGWVFWSALPQAGLDSVTLYRGGGAGPFGAGALSGVIDLESRRVEEGLNSRVAGGSRGLFEGDVLAGAHIGDVGVRLAAFGAREAGFFLLSKDQRGRVDARAAYHHYGASLDVSTYVVEDTILSLRMAGFAERRINGFEEAPNETEGGEASLRLAHEGGEDRPSWSLVTYGQEREFAQVFVAVDDARESLRPVLDQFDVPGRAYGLRADYRLPWAGGAQETRFSADARWAEGETNELFRNLGAGFTRRRTAGGNQRAVGIAADHAFKANQDWLFNIGVRVDNWRNHKGFRQEFDLSDERVLLDAPVEDQGNWRASSRIGALYRFTPALHLRAAAYTGFRIPTLNELHRPFRVGNDITEANAELRPERLRGAEVGIRFEPLSSIRTEITYFANWLRDAIGNVTLAQGPGVFPIAGFVPAGGSLRQRQNIDRLRIDGIEWSLVFPLASTLELNAHYNWTKARVAKADSAPDLVGNRLIQVPRHSGRVAFKFMPNLKWDAQIAVRYSSRQFDDDLNERVLEGYAAVDASLHYRLSEQVGVSLSGENLTDTQIEAAISGDGLITRATPLTIRAGIEISL